MIPETCKRTRRVNEALLRSVDLSGKTALVTGATSGLGKATARALAERGALVVLGVRNVDAGAKVAREINQSLPKKPTLGSVLVGSVMVGGEPLDLESNESVKRFAKWLISNHSTLDVLVNNAGLNFLDETFTEMGVTTLVQINFLGPAVLTRLLEKPLRLAATKNGIANVVNVSSVTHRYAAIGSTKQFLNSGLTHGSYACTKLANVVFANECQRRWGEFNVVSSAVDPGAVFSSLWLRDTFFSKKPVLFLLGLLYAPPNDGATAVVMAALQPFLEGVESPEPRNPKIPKQNRNPKHSAAEAAAAAVGAYFPREMNEEETNASAPSSSTPNSSRFRFYARGLFASFPVTCCGPGDSRGVTGKGVTKALRNTAWTAHLLVWGVFTLFCSVCDWPARRVFGSIPFGVGRGLHATCEVPSSTGSYDEQTGKELWEEAGEAAGLTGAA